VRSDGVTQRRSREVKWENGRTGGHNSNLRNKVSGQEAATVTKRYVRNFGVVKGFGFGRIGGYSNRSIDGGLILIYY